MIKKLLCFQLLFFLLVSDSKITYGNQSSNNNGKAHATNCNRALKGQEKAVEPEILPQLKSWIKTADVVSFVTATDIIGLESNPPHYLVSFATHSLQGSLFCQTVDQNPITNQPLSTQQQLALIVRIHEELKKHNIDSGLRGFVLKPDLILAAKTPGFPQVEVERIDYAILLERFDDFWNITANSRSTLLDGLSQQQRDQAKTTLKTIETVLNGLRVWTRHPQFLILNTGGIIPTQLDRYEMLAPGDFKKLNFDEMIKTLFSPFMR